VIRWYCSIFLSTMRVCAFLHSWVLRWLAAWHVGMLACWHLTCCAGLAILQVVASWTPGLLCSSTLVCWLLDTLCWTPWTPELLMDSWTLMDSSSRWSGCNLPIYSMPGNGNTRNKRFIKQLKI
jgi:hypothetical protein